MVKKTKLSVFSRGSQPSHWNPAKGTRPKNRAPIIYIVINGVITAANGLTNCVAGVIPKP